MPAADLTFIMNLNAAAAMSLGFVNGPLLRTFGYRVIGVVAALFFIVGLALTAYASSVVDFIIFYGLVNGKCLLAIVDGKLYLYVFSVIMEWLRVGWALEQTFASSAHQHIVLFVSK